MARTRGTARPGYALPGPNSCSSQFACLIHVHCHGLGLDDHSIDVSGSFDGDLAIQYVISDPFHISLERIAPSPSAGYLDAKDVPVVHLYGLLPNFTFLPA